MHQFLTVAMTSRSAASKGSKNKMDISNGIFHEGGWSCVPLTFFSVFLLKKYLELSPSRIGWKLVILRVVLVAGGGGGSDA